MRCTLAHLKGTGAVLRSDDGQEITVPLTEIPDGAAEGDILNFRCSTDAVGTHDETAHARAVLNELLDPNHEA